MIYVWLSKAATAGNFAFKNSRNAPPPVEYSHLSAISYLQSPPAVATTSDGERLGLQQSPVPILSYRYQTGQTQTRQPDHSTRWYQRFELRCDHRRGFRADVQNHVVFRHRSLFSRLLLRLLKFFGHHHIS